MCYETDCTRLGIRTANDTTTRRLDLPGVLIIQVNKGSAAATAGLRSSRRDARGRLVLGDVIIHIEDDRVQSSDDLMTILDKYQVGDTVSVTVIRDDKRLTLPVTLQALR